MMEKVVVACTPMRGHVIRMLAIAAELTRRGHEVVVCTEPPFAERVRAIGAKWFALPGAADFDELRHPIDSPGRGEFPDSPDGTSFGVTHQLLDLIPDQFHGLRNLLADFPAGVVIVDNEFLGILPLVLHRPRAERPAVLAVGVTPPRFDSIDTPPYGPGLSPLPGEVGRHRDAVMYEQMDELTEPVQKHTSSTLASLGVPTADSVANLMASAPDHFLQLTVPGFEYPRSDAPTGFQFVGPIVPDAAHDPVPAPWLPDLAGGPPVVTVTHDVLQDRAFSQLVVPAIAALADQDVTVIAQTSRSDGADEMQRLLGRIPGNTRIEAFPVLHDLLPYTSVLVSTGSYDHAHAALRHGVPMVVAATSQDELEVAARVAWAGAGINLHTGEPTHAAIRDAVLRVLDEVMFRYQAGRLQREIATYHPLDLIAEIIEGDRDGR